MAPRNFRLDPSAAHLVLASAWVDGAGHIAERYGGDSVLLGRDHDDLASARWLQARLRPVTWAAHRPPGQAWVPSRANGPSYPARASSLPAATWNQTVIPAPS